MKKLMEKIDWHIQFVERRGLEWDILNRRNRHGVYIWDSPRLIGKAERKENAPLHEVFAEALASVPDWEQYPLLNHEHDDKG